MRSDRKILIIDDNKDIHADFRKVFDIAHHYAEDLDELEADLFGTSNDHQVNNDVLLQVALDFAYQGEEGIEKAREAARQYFDRVRGGICADPIRSAIDLTAPDAAARQQHGLA